MLRKYNVGDIMLKKFMVDNFKGFEQTLTLDLTARDYSFNTSLVQNNVVNKAIIYGKNGIGKSSLGIALFDIVSHLTDKEKMPLIYLSNYRNLNRPEDPVSFTYIFKFGEEYVKYSYKKMDQNNLVSEQLFFNDTLMIDFDYFNINNQFVAEELRGSLNIDLVDNKLSILKYIYRNTPTKPNSLINDLFDFCENMLWYRGLSEGNAYSGFTSGRSILVERLYESGKVDEFRRFLKENGIEYRLKFESINGNHQLFAYFNNDKNKAPFESLASTGTMALLLFFIWKITAFTKISLLFIDEFDAFLHYESSEELIKLLNKERLFQSFVTTHNTNLMNNKLTRPDCCFIMTKNKISSLINATDRELREGHNLEKLFINGEFNDKE